MTHILPPPRLEYEYVAVFFLSHTFTYACIYTRRSFTHTPPPTHTHMYYTTSFINPSSTHTHLYIRGVLSLTDAHIHRHTYITRTHTYILSHLLHTRHDSQHRYKHMHSYIHISYQSTVISRSIVIKCRKCPLRRNHVLCVVNMS
jgi:hypothetical protein